MLRGISMSEAQSVYGSKGGGTSILNSGVPRYGKLGTYRSSIYIQSKKAKGRDVANKNEVFKEIDLQFKAAELNKRKSKLGLHYVTDDNMKGTKGSKKTPKVKSSKGRKYMLNSASKYTKKLKETLNNKVYDSELLSEEEKEFANTIKKSSDTVKKTTKITVKTVKTSVKTTKKTIEIGAKTVKTVGKLAASILKGLGSVLLALAKVLLPILAVILVIAFMGIIIVVIAYLLYLMAGEGKINSEVAKAYNDYLVEYFSEYEDEDDVVNDIDYSELQVNIISYWIAQKSANGMANKGYTTTLLSDMTVDELKEIMDKLITEKKYPTGRILLYNLALSEIEHDERDDEENQIKDFLSMYEQYSKYEHSWDAEQLFTEELDSSYELQVAFSKIRDYVNDTEIDDNQKILPRCEKIGSYSVASILIYLHKSWGIFISTEDSEEGLDLYNYFKSQNWILSKEENKNLGDIMFYQEGNDVIAYIVFGTSMFGYSDLDSAVHQWGDTNISEFDKDNILGYGRAEIFK